ncbi:MAG: nuclear transport factor 2 family protein [Gammaproteobacteria bacterium]|nr:nuclear transport factor 2 family protein [Gammaproteobacteria bacterium]MCW5582419.1 nuclear transport factor 2 family protein [Gammaproteobacteria bacterium]
MLKKLITVSMLSVTLMITPTLLFADSKLDCRSYSNTEKNNIELVKKIFNTNVWKPGKSEAEFAKIYSKDLVFYGNGSTENYEKFKNHMSKNVDFWEWNQIRFEDIFAKGDKVIARIHVKAKSKKGKIYELDSMELFEIKNNHVVRWWETSYPDWRQMVKESGEAY